MTLSKDKVLNSLSVLYSASSDVHAELVSKKCRSVSYEMRIVLKQFSFQTPTPNFIKF